MEMDIEYNNDSDDSDDNETSNETSDETSDDSETISSSNPENIKIKFKRFITGLKEYNLTLDELNETGWHYYGGTIHVSTETKKATKKHYNKLMLINPDACIRNIITTAKNYTSIIGKNGREEVDMCEFRKCVCHETIKNLCFIANADRTEYFIIGNCCIKSFIKANTITCEKCGKKHRNKIKNLCNDCKECQKCVICGFPHKNLNHDMCNKCYNKKECKECKLKFSKKDYNKETERCKLCDKKYCANCYKKKNPKFIQYPLCYPCKFQNNDSKKKDKSDTEVDSESEEEISEKKCIDCNKIIKPNFERCFNCNNKKKDNIESESNSDHEEEISETKKCIDCNKDIKPNFDRCFNCNDKKKNKSNTDSKKEISLIKKCIGCNKSIEQKFTKCFNCNKKK